MRGFIGRWRNLVVSISALLTACSEEGARSTIGPASVPVELAVVVAEDLPVIVRAVGTLEARRAVGLRAERSARVVELHAGEGTLLAKGTRLARLDDAEPRAALVLAEAVLAEAVAHCSSAENTHRRTLSLQREGVSSSESLDEARLVLDAARASVESARARVSLARLEVEHSELRAPFAGVLGRWGVDRGAFVQRGEILGHLVDDDPLDLVFAVPGRLAARILSGAEVEGMATEGSDSAFVGRVRLVEPMVDPESRTVNVEARVPNPARRLRPGQLATVGLVLERHLGAAVLPEEAIVAVGQKHLVFVVEGESARPVVVELGARLPGRVEIFGDVKAGMTVVRSGQQRLSPETSTQVKAVEVDDDRPAG